MPHRLADPLAGPARGRRWRPWSTSPARLLAEGYPLRTIDIGGGLGVNYEEGTRPDVAAFAAAVVPRLRDLGLTVLLEPGRSLVARAGVLLTRVLYVKENHGKRFVIVDAGMNDLLRPALYKAHHRIEPVATRGRESRNVDVVGPVCETADAFARDRELESVEPGELLADPRRGRLRLRHGLHLQHAAAPGGGPDRGRPACGSSAAARRSRTSSAPRCDVESAR